MYAQDHARAGTKKDAFIYVAVNAYWEDVYYELPIIPQGMKWHLRLSSSGDVYSKGKEKTLGDQGSFMLGARSTLVLIAK